MFLAKFAQRFSILSDEMAQVIFQAEAGGENRYSMMIKSDHMNSCVTNKQFEGRLRDNTDVQQEYITTFKKEVFLKFFHALKLPGSASLKISNAAKMEMEFKYEKCPTISVIQEVASRVI